MKSIDINNDFRQISVLPQVANVLERIQLKLNLKDLSLNASQHAFTADRSTMTALASITQDWYNAADSASPYNDSAWCCTSSKNPLRRLMIMRQDVN